LSERELIEAVLAGDARAERALYEAHVDRVYRLCFRLTNGDDARAQDCTQETFVRAFGRLADFRGDAALSTWIYRIGVSMCLNEMRRVKRWSARETALDDAPQITLRQPRAEPDLRTKLRRAVDDLPEHYRVVFVMYDMEGYTHDEIGAVLEMPTGTSKARLSRARARLRKALSEFEGEWAS
jgi:RNA polymerase sigma-70 factor, ECF subfamily